MGCWPLRAPRASLWALCEARYIFEPATGVGSPDATISLTLPCPHTFSGCSGERFFNFKDL